MYEKLRADKEAKSKEEKEKSREKFKKDHDSKPGEKLRQILIRLMLNGNLYSK